MTEVQANPTTAETTGEKYYPGGLFLARLAPAVLFALTVASTLFVGGLALALPIMLIALVHSLGHHLVARHFGVTSSLPYFVPQLSLSGTSGAFIKVKWPILDRNALMAIFLAGPILGIAASLLFLFFGLFYSEVSDNLTGEDFIKLGEPLVMKLLTKIVFPGMKDDQTLALSAAAFGGWCGLLMNLLHMWPIGRLDGGRVVYALWGYKAVITSSILAILALCIVSFYWPHWWGFVMICGLSMIQLRQQYPADVYEGELHPVLKWLALVFPILIILCFEPEPFRFLSP